jgi:hypothetical protein
MFGCDGRHTCGVKCVDRRGERGVLGVVSFGGWPSSGVRVGSSRRAAPRNHWSRGGSSPVRLIGRPGRVASGPNTAPTQKLNRRPDPGPSEKPYPHPTGLRLNVTTAVGLSSQMGGWHGNREGRDICSPGPT